MILFEVSTIKSNIHSAAFIVYATLNTFCLTFVDYRLMRFCFKEKFFVQKEQEKEKTEEDRRRRLEELI